MTRDFESLASSRSVIGPPEVSHQKDDVVFIRNPAQQWQNGHIISLGTQKAIIISLMEKRAIALLLSRKTEGYSKPAFTQDDLFRVKLSWD